MEEAITALLMADARLRFLVGDRIHWGRLPQGAWPDAYLILQLSGAPDDYVNSGRSSIQQSRLQIDGYASVFLTARDIAATASRLLEQYRGVIAGRALQGGFIAGRRDFQSDGAEGTVRLFRRSIDVLLWHSP